MSSSPRSDDDDVLDHLQALMFQCKLHLRAALQDDTAGLAPMEARALAFFARHPGATQRDLVQHSGRDKAQITRLIKVLLDRGFLSSEADPEDRRCQRLQPTETGRAMQRALQKQRKRLAAEVVADLSAQEQAQLKALLQRMRARLERNASHDAAPRR